MSVCRVCLCSKPRKDITQLNHLDPTKNGAEQSYKHVILFCLGLQIDINLNMSTKLCVKCYRKIIQFYQFKTLAQRNEAHLRSLDSSELISDVFMNDNSIKIEQVSDDNDCENLDEPLIQVKDEDKTEDLIDEVKGEYYEDQSDDELLSLIKTLKYQTAEETKENAQLKEESDGPKKPKAEKQKVKSKEFDECGKEVKDLRTHLLKHIPVEVRKQIKCELCDKEFISSRAQKLHIKRKHQAVKKQCHLCNKSVMHLRLHILKMHETDSLKFQCLPCGRRFLTQAILNTHISVHSKDRPHECVDCGNKFRTKFCLMAHKRRVHDKERTYLCQICSKSFYKKHNLQVHLRSHTNEKPYTCPDCGKQMKFSSIRNHQLIHNHEKNHKCTMCDMSFVSPKYLRSHLISHKKEKRYPCRYCDVKFHRSDHRKRHEFTAHLKHSAWTTV